MSFTQLETRFVEFDDEILNEDRLIIVSTQYQAVTLTIPGIKDDLFAAGNPFVLDLHNVAILHLFGDKPLQIKFSDNDHRQIFYADDTKQQRSLSRNKLIYLRRKDVEINTDFDFDPAKIEKYIRFGWDVDEELILVNKFEESTSDILQLSSRLSVNNSDLQNILQYYIIGFLNIEPGVDILVLLVTDDEGSTWRQATFTPELESVLQNLKIKSDIQQSTDFENRFFKLIVQRAPTNTGFEQIITNLDEWA